MSAPLKVRCLDCTHVATVSFTTDGKGHMVEVGDWCDHQLDRRWLCRQCRLRPRRSQHKRSTICQACWDANRAAERQYESLRRSQDPAIADAKRLQAREAKRRLLADPEKRARHYERRRRHHRAKMATDPKYRQRYRARRKKEIPERGTPEWDRYIAYHRDYNKKASRDEAKRDERTWKKGKSDLSFCWGCGGLTQWRGVGKRPRWCILCHPHREDLARQPRALAWECYRPKGRRSPPPPTSVPLRFCHGCGALSPGGVLGQPRKYCPACKLREHVLRDRPAAEPWACYRCWGDPLPVRASALRFCRGCGDHLAGRPRVGRPRTWCTSCRRSAPEARPKRRAAPWASWWKPGDPLFPKSTELRFCRACGDYLPGGSPGRPPAWCPTCRPYARTLRRLLEEIGAAGGPSETPPATGDGRSSRRKYPKRRELPPAEAWACYRRPGGAVLPRRLVPGCDWGSEDHQQCRGLIAWHVEVVAPGERWPLRRRLCETHGVVAQATLDDVVRAL
ncbi:MAG TPA: hypothetical protein VK399_17715, partial [Longimicrobiaceae bacterium]|nr:hypothetical protein [Longimicrobiaceae bacterium]